MQAICRWSEREIARGIAIHESGIQFQFDIVELLYAILICLEFGPSPERLKFASKALTILFSKHFANGCFAPSTPVLADKRNFSLLCPTAEVLALLLRCESSILFPFTEELLSVFEWLKTRKADGWISEWTGRNGEATGFMTASALSFLAGLHNFLDEALSHIAARQLNVRPFVENLDLSEFRYPENLREVLNDHVIIPHSRQDLLSLASYSMIFYGPPGSAKTTLAKKIANDLHWPLLVINQSAFLRYGIDGINAEAEKIFRFAYFLKRVVILFDEVEELVQDREEAEQIGRLLTTSMLPRLHDLRDRKRVIFIFATNHVEAIDRAAARLGRFDIVKCVLPPTLADRSAILEKQLKKWELSDDVIQIFDRLNVATETEHFGFMDLQTLVKNVRIELEIRPDGNINEVVRKKLEISKRAVDGTLVESFKQTSLKVDRP